MQISDHVRWRDELDDALGKPSVVRAFLRVRKQSEEDKLMRTSILATIFAFGTVIAVPALAQQSTGTSSQQQMQDEADKGIKTRNSGESGYVGEQERPGASSHVPGQPDTKSNQTTTVPVQPERSQQQSRESREEDRDRGEDRRVGRDWRAYPSDRNSRGPMGQNDIGRMRDRMERDTDSDHRTVGRDWRVRPDDERADRNGYGRGYYDEDRPRRRVKVCVEYEDGDEYCHYR
jgi:hypothetical protein